MPTVLYKYCDFILQSNVPLSGLVTAMGEAAYTFQLIPIGRPEPVLSNWLHLWRYPDGKVWLACAKQKSGYLLRFHYLADFLVSAAGKQIRCYPEPGTPLETIRHLFLDQVLPLVLSQWGRLVLHASAVVTPEGAIAFLGESGQGKSTLSASFCRQGFPMLTDDCLLLEEKRGQLFGIPSYPALRLWPESVSALTASEAKLTEVAHYTEKKWLGLNSGWLTCSSEPIPLRQVYLLSSPEEVGETRRISIVPLSPQEALVALVKHAFRLNITDRARLRAEFEHLSRVAASLIVYRLTFPRDFSLLPAVREAILQNRVNRFLT